MDARKDLPVLIAVILLALILAGEFVVFSAGHGDYGSDVVFGEDSISYEIRSNGPHVYDVVVMDGSAGSPTDVSVYYDPSYASNISDVMVAVGGRALDQEYYVQQMGGTLRMRGVDDVSTIDADDMLALMESPGKGHALVCLSGSLPSDVYDGTPDSPVFKWLASGGRLYWAGNAIGAYCSEGETLRDIGSEGTALFLGSDCIEGDSRIAYGECPDGSCSAFSFQNNQIAYSPSIGKLPSDRAHAHFGFSDGERSSISLIQYGEGFVCIIGGDYSNFQRIDLGQVIASGLSPTTVIVDHIHGSVNGRTTGTALAGDHVYISLGGYFPVYGELKEADRCSMTRSSCARASPP